MSCFSHIVFALKNSRYEIEKINRKKPYGYIAPTYPFIEGQEEEILIDELCKAAATVSISVINLNFCGDHVHAVLKSETYDLSRKIGQWKGKTAYEFNRRVNPSVNSQMTTNTDGTKQALWAKGYYQKYLDSEDKISKAANYVKNNRAKHDLPPLSPSSLAHINELIRKSIDYD